VTDENAIAVIGMSGRFPGARDVAELWHNLCGGKESVSFFTDEELAAAGVPERVYSGPQYVRGRASLGEVDTFDAGFFGFNAREAELTDPQHRMFLETCWEALEAAGYDPFRHDGRIGVYGGESPPTYLLSTLVNDPVRGAELLTNMQALYGNMSGFLATRVAYKLDLRGPAITVQTACSTSLVAVHLAVQSLLCGECEMALAGGVAVQVPDRIGYYYQDGGIFSLDGHCRAYSADAGGTVGGSGVGAVVLKPLGNALEDGDFVWGVIRGTAVNNDGAVKVGYSAPSVSGQAAVIADALAVCDVPPETIGYVEGHGTGTPLGDPIEVAALTEAWRKWTDATEFCALGSVKTNVGHLDGAAGVTGLIKALLAVRSGTVPPTLNFAAPNEKIDFASSPFFVNTEPIPWPLAGHPRRAAVSSFGLGGTNAHVVLEEAPPVRTPASEDRWQILPMSARSWQALDTMSERLRGFLQARPDVPLADVAYTLQEGRHSFDCRRAVVCRDREDAVVTGRVVERYQPDVDRSVVFLFPGNGAEYAGMAQGLYESQPVFREELDRCAELLGADILTDRTPGPPALFSVEYALAKLLMSWGVRPSAMIGHSLGEYVAACLAGVFSLSDALSVVTARARLVQQTQPGAMLAVALGENEARRQAGSTVDIAAVNAPGLTVLSGAADAMAEMAARLDVRQWTVNSRIGYHSALVEEILDTFTEEVSRVRLAEPSLPFIACPSGTWITPEQATDPRYWAAHLRGTVRFSDGLKEVLRDPDTVLIEVGPGRTLSMLAEQHADEDVPVLPTMRKSEEDEPDQAVLLRAAAGLWASGVDIDWAGVRGDGRRLRVPLPTYPFERKRYWLGDNGERPTEAEPEQRVGHRRPDLGHDLVPPADELEEALATIWRELLGFDEVGVLDDFYTLGGHSLLATQLIGRIRQTFPATFSLDDIADNRTIRAQAERIRAKLAHALAEMSDEEVERQLGGLS
jgi:phthiocerol/phenolphthiocerol synthesis type-I polyketide synthase E